MNKPVITFEKYEILSIDYKKYDENEIEDSSVFRDASMGISSDNESGKIEITVKVSDPLNSRTIGVKIRGYFIVNIDLDIDQIKLYLSQNGIAMLYPYVRSIISMVSSLDAETSILLPTINTVKGNE